MSPLFARSRPVLRWHYRCEGSIFSVTDSCVWPGLAVLCCAVFRFASGVPWEPLLEVESPSMHSRLHLVRSGSEAFFVAVWRGIGTGVAAGGGTRQRAC